MIKDCPFCGSNRVAVRIKDSRFKAASTAVHCGDCGARGPKTEGAFPMSRRLAEHDWNAREGERAVVFS